MRTKIEVAVSVRRDEVDWQQRPSGLLVPTAHHEVAQDADPAVQSSELGAGAKSDLLSGIVSLATRLAPFIIGAIPVLLPLLCLSSIGDPAVLRVLLWRGNLVALFVSVVPSVLPLLAGSVAFVCVHHFATKEKYWSGFWSALSVSVAALMFSPVGLSSVQVISFVLLLHALRPSRRASPKPRMLEITAVVFVAVSTAFVFGAASWGYLNIGVEAVPRAVTGRILYGLPQEVVVEEDGRVGYYYIVDVDELNTIAITGYPSAVRYIDNDLIVGRFGCRRVTRWNEIRGMDLLWRANQHAGSPLCEKVADCIRDNPRDQRVTVVAMGCCVEPSGAAPIEGTQPKRDTP